MNIILKIVLLFALMNIFLGLKSKTETKQPCIPCVDNGACPWPWTRCLTGGDGRRCCTI